MQQGPAGAFVFKPRTGIAAWALWAVLAAVWLIFALQAGTAAVLTQAPWIGLLSTIAYAVCARPRVLVGDRDVVLRNVIRDVTIPYPAITAVSTQYTLTISTTDGGRHQAWAAPAGGRFGATRVTEDDRKTIGWTGADREIPASAGLRSDAGAAAAAIRRHWQPGGDIAGIGASSVEIRWATEVLAILAACTVAVVLSLVL